MYCYCQKMIVIIIIRGNLINTGHSDKDVNINFLWEEFKAKTIGA